MLMARKFETDEEECKKEYAEYEAAEKKLIDSYRKREGPRELTITVNALWVKIDKLRAEWNWRPIRDINSVGGVDQADVERYVSYADVEGALFDFESEEIVVQLVLDIIEELGGDIYGKVSGL
ncbi:unnamed protein product [Anisakis simplex]|uniref:Integrase n=1 Tax=Anisakis simplex TaxID=6269 RepID=A0A0M3JMC8_ANISI|nr:unnamed protein product [Anisakis simplex]